jgi:ferredoxin-NADP reductase
VLGARAALGADPLDAQALAQLVPDLGERELVVCAPSELAAQVVRAGRDAGLPTGRIHVGVFAL